ncbi:hypothetical protein ABE607_15520 [Comamonas aquatica]|uniref:hypothetical protein n=1 Tax=Comamonas aquatica TaxID=225991 RepID=UPI002447C096|nr:hypothetical protein [Comamonas aquatica]MDH1903078.1 hypothetical protein [Comamonas aquatica]
MIFPEVKNLYKYTSINENSLSILIKEEFWFAKPSTFNDPLDCGISLFNSISKEQFLIKANKALANAKKNSKAWQTKSRAKPPNQSHRGLD